MGTKISILHASPDFHVYPVELLFENRKCRTPVTYLYLLEIVTMSDTCMGAHISFSATFFFEISAGKRATHWSIDDVRIYADFCSTVCFSPTGKSAAELNQVGNGSCYTCFYGNGEAPVPIPEMQQDAGCQEPFSLGTNVFTKTCDFPH